ncbi:hypothetical protein [Cupriavidus pauculus]|uniref:hypothetical protein n=1 Tax=Cupriavidus pauculus TaxID=82633 RepID=UPI001EE26690|nr:hypothetical protein [Cupriavidus pauculus]GJG96768.1 hypothetical protein CBA19C6_19785 [Cupriavidus pauculus]
MNSPLANPLSSCSYKAHLGFDPQQTSKNERGDNVKIGSSAISVVHRGFFAGSRIYRGPELLRHNKRMHAVQFRCNGQQPLIVYLVISRLPFAECPHHSKIPSKRTIGLAVNRDSFDFG